MQTPVASRPYMPDYGVVGEKEGTGLMSWSWAEQQLQSSKNFWLATRWPGLLVVDLLREQTVGEVAELLHRHAEMLRTEVVAAVADADIGHTGLPAQSATA